MNDPALIADLIRAGLDPDLVARVAAEIIDAHQERAADVSQIVRDTMREMSGTAARTYERDRKRNYRLTQRNSSGNAKANDVAPPAVTPPIVPQNVPDTSEKSDDLFSKIQNSSDGKEARVQTESLSLADARGSRLSPSWLPSAQDVQFAFDAGMTSDDIRKLCAEFVDYWISIPGIRGRRSNWSATFRNRVRAVAARGSHGKPAKQSSLMETIDHLIARTTGGEVESDHPMRDITPRGARSDEGPFEAMAAR